MDLDKSYAIMGWQGLSQSLENGSTYPSLMQVYVWILMEANSK